jgi:hypothetical protein
MCRILARDGLLAALAGLAGFLGGAVITVFGFIALWWSFPAAWTPADGLTGAPQSLLGMDVPQQVVYLQTADGGRFACLDEECTPAPSAVNIQPCSAGSRPAVTSLFPLLVNWNASAVLGCELSYQSTGRTVFVLYDRQGRTYFSGGPTFIPTDAGVIIVGLIGGLVAAMLAALIAGGLLIARRRRKDSAASLPAPA